MTGNSMFAVDSEELCEKQPLVSVLLVTYNFEDFINEALQAIVIQDYERMEIIICDDWSIDKTRVIIGEWHKQFPDKIRLSFTPRNLGTTRNLNAGLKLAKGKYWALTSGDDVFLPGKIKAQVEFMEANPSCVICYHDQLVFETSNPEAFRLNSQIEKPREGGLHEVVRYGTFCGGSSMMIRVREPKTLLRENIKFASDWLFLFDCVKNGGKVSYLNMTLAKYRRHEKNVTTTKSFRNNIDITMSAIKIAIENPKMLFVVALRVLEGLIRVLRRVAMNQKFYKLE